ncbi:CPBP family intramembrane glutamic endopeptidase [Clostridium manihotivorum]|uniref:CAAX prenyl protease 2/Lysostaphin resistance protein A-like domain-containing protein n=1 Tax=Clostridium manihotivorum TaxID=2320868 RepID=A0A3R5QR13_9CLOT|nr:type II CAAX endopeptidase family protein [Clostridium manihotivorum]QAA30248.1 hypothetical protein C1I91_00290 [Clostridium manihotivorum]
MNLRKLIIFNPFIDLEEEKVSPEKFGIFVAIMIAVLFALIIPFAVDIVLMIGSAIKAYSVSPLSVDGAIKGIEKSQSFLLISTLISFLLTIIIMWKGFTKKTHNYFPERKFKTSDILGVIALILGFRLLFSGSLSYLVDLIPVPDFIEKAFDQMFINPAIGIITAVIIAPIQEEFVNRGIILNGLSKKYSPKVALVISALIFAAMHMNLPQGINAFLLGLILGYVYLSTKSIFLSILCHATNNICAIIPELKNIHNIYLLVATSIAVVVVGILLMRFGLKRLDLKNRRIHYDSIRNSTNFDKELDFNI